MVTQVISDCYGNVTDHKQTLVNDKRDTFSLPIAADETQFFVCLLLFLLPPQAMSIYKKLDHTVPQPSLKDEVKNEEGV